MFDQKCSGVNYSKYTPYSIRESTSVFMDGKTNSFLKIISINLISTDLLHLFTKLRNEKTALVQPIILLAESSEIS
ncbi:hypothetical protein HGA88_06750 [Candidatus Roizmanbacteria bacterium]|nr:hypothetical protein [Candidatus Roizmanbacteria bacterium]